MLIISCWHEWVFSENLQSLWEDGPLKITGGGLIHRSSTAPCRNTFRSCIPSSASWRRQANKPKQKNMNLHGENTACFNLERWAQPINKTMLDRSNNKIGVPYNSRNLCSTSESAPFHPLKYSFVSGAFRGFTGEDADEQLYKNSKTKTPHWLLRHFSFTSGQDHLDEGGTQLSDGYFLLWLIETTVWV